MSKKTFSAAPKPKPSDEQIIAFEKGGKGHDKQAPKKAATESTKRLSLDLPASTHTRFKTACTATGRKMVAEIQEFIESRMVELEKEAGISR